MVKAPKIYVINLARRPDRRAAVLARLKAAGTPFAITVVEAVDEMHLTPDYLAARGVAPFAAWHQPHALNVWHGRPLKTGEIACSMSHWKAWQNASDDGTETAIFLEDDAHFAPDLWQRLVPAAAALSETSWDLFYLGRRPLGEDRHVAESSPLVTPGFSYCSHAYALSRRGIQKLLSTSLMRHVVPIDEFLPALYAEHPRVDIVDLFPGPRLVAFATAENYVGQAAGLSDVEMSPSLAAQC